MKKDPENATTVEGKGSGNRNGPARPTRSSKHNEVYQRIVCALLAHEALSCGDIADKSGYGDKKSTRYSYVRRQVLDLYKKHLLEREPDSSPKRYRIRRDLALIREIYNDEIYASVRSDFQKSAWLRELIIRTHIPEFETDKAFLDDVRMMLKTSKLMFEWYLRGTPSKTLNETRLAVLADPLPTPKVTVYGLNTAPFEAERRKCQIYELYLAWVLGERQDAFTAGKVQENLLKVIEGMRHISAGIKLTALSYALSYAGLQGMARYADAVQGIEGHPPPVFPNLVHDYNAITRRIDPFAADPETWTTAAKSMRALHTEVTRRLDGESAIDVSSGVIVEPAKTLGNVLRTTRAKKRDEQKERKD
jgi:hypothetical protein